MVQPAHDRQCNHLVACMMREFGWSAWARNLLLDPLMRSCLVEVAHIGNKETLELLFLEDQQVVQAFLPHAPHEALVYGIGSWSVIWRFQDLMPLVVATCVKHDPNLPSSSRMRYFGACPYSVASRSCWATQRSEGDRVTPTWITRRDFSSTMKNAKSGRKKRSITCKKS